MIPTGRPGTPVARLLALYSLLAGIALLFPHRPGTWPALLLVHVIALFLWRRTAADAEAARRGGSANAAATRAPSPLRGLLDWYPILVIPLLYSELPLLNQSVHDGGYFDAHVLAWEERLFGGQPSRELAGRWSNLFVSEVLHAAYISYYPIIYGPPLLLYFRRSREAFSRVIFTLLLAFFVHYLFFIYYPVQGPRYLFETPVPESARGPVFTLAQDLLQVGSSRGAAFPSSHIGVAVAQTAMAFSLVPRWFPVLLALTAGLGVGAVYGGFHYATDMVAGVLFGLLAFLAAPSLWRTLGGSPP